MKIKTKIILLPVSLIVILLTVSFLTIMFFSRSITQNQIENHLWTTAQSRAHHIKTLLKEYKELTKMASTGNPFRDIVDERADFSVASQSVNRRIPNIIKSYPEIERVRVLNKNGVIIASSAEDIGIDISDKTIFLKGRENVYAGELHISELSGNFVISISAPIMGRDNFSGVLVLNFSVEQGLYKMLADRTGLGKTGETYLVNKERFLISPSLFVADAVLKTKVNTEQVNLCFSEHLKKGLLEEMEESPTIYPNYRNRKVLGVHYYISEMQWALITEVDEREAFLSINKLFAILVIIFAGLLIVTIVINFIAAKKIISPIEELHKGSEEIMKGNLDYQVGIKSNDEIGQLSKSFDLMANRLSESKKELQKHTEKLEEQVKERTIDLEKQFEKSEKQRIATLSVLTDLNKTTVNLKAEITERKQAEAKLIKLSTAVKQSPSIIAITDLDGNLEYANPKFTDLTGYSLEEAIGQNPRILKSGEQADEMYKELWETISSGKEWRGEFYNKKKNGELFWEMASVSPIFDEQGKIINYIKVAEDITERKQAEEALLRQERLSAIGELASGVAHDFNNALQIILGGVEMAMVSEDPDELNQYLESIKQSAGDAASRVRQLQRFSQKSQAQKESVPIDINKLAKDVIKETKLFINQYQKKGIHIEIKSDYQTKSNIEGVEGELRACLFNLIKNSAEAMTKGGTITISTDEYDDNAYVSVADTGSGMDKETQKKIFQPFYSTKGFEPGRGLGMAQVYSTIRDHNGDIYIKESEVGQGTVIEFALPISKKESILEKKEKDYAGTANILWVDDEEMIRTLGENMLKMLGHTGDFAANGKEALEFLAKGNKYDLVITDIGMPGMSGWQLAEKIKNHGYNTRIAVVTGWGADVSQEQKNQYNVGYVLGKPIQMNDLKALIGEVLQMKNISGKERKNE